jgi:hypothetical protein
MSLVFRFNRVKRKSHTSYMGYRTLKKIIPEVSIRHSRPANVDWIINRKDYKDYSGHSK